MEFELDCKLDNLVFYVEMVDRDDWSRFIQRISQCEENGELPPVYHWIGKGYSDYHYNMNVGSGGGAINIGFKHNSVRENATRYRMRVEFNPQKDGGRFRAFWDTLNSVFLTNSKLIKQLDLAFDYDVEIKRLFAISLTGRQRSYFKSTQYFGSKGSSGYLKIYDKKTELKDNQGVDIIAEHRTRIEYTLKLEDPVTLHLLSKASTTINSEYKIVHLDVEKLTGELKASVLAIYHGWMKYGEFTRTTKTKIKKALESMESLDLDHAYKKAQPKIIETVKSYFSASIH